MTLPNFDEQRLRSRGSPCVYCFDHTGYEVLMSLYPWLEEALVLTQLNMPYSSFQLIFEGNQDTTERAWKWLTQAAAVAEAFWARYPPEFWTGNNFDPTTGLESVPPSFPGMVCDIKEGKIPVSFGEEFNPDLGFPLSSSDLLVLHSDWSERDWNE
jgi:hypothetical protein